MAQCEKKMLTEHLKNLCYQNGKEKSPKVSAKILHKLGILYRRKSPDRTCLLQSIALMTSATVREPDNIEEIKESLDEVCSHVLQLAGTKNSAPHLLDDIVSDLKQQVRSLRDAVEEKLNAIKKISSIGEGKVIQEIAESRKIQEVNDLQEYITHRYTKLMNCVCESCVSIMGNPPCKYALVGLGSLARKEVTPYSDFESIIVLEEDVQQTDDYPHVLEYFRWLATIFQMILIRLGETVLRFMAIPCLNDPLNTENNWFYDACTPCGICPDGFAPAASKNPLGRQTETPVKPWTTELIKPVSEMVKYLNAEEDLKNGYHLSDILMKTCFVSGKREVYHNFEHSIQDKRTSQLLKHKEETLKRILNQLQEDFDWYNKLTLNANVKDFLDIKRILYRGSTLFVSTLGSLYGLKECSCQEILDRLRILGVLSPDDCHKVKLCISVSCEFRLRLYTYFQGQRDLVSQRYFPDQHCGALDEVLHDMSKNVVVAGVTYAILLRQSMSLMETGTDIPKQLVLPLESLWLRANVCVDLRLYETGLTECLTKIKNGACYSCSHFDLVGFNVALHCCLGGSGQVAKAVVITKQFLSKFRNFIPTQLLSAIYQDLGKDLGECRKFKSSLKYLQKRNKYLYFDKEKLTASDNKNLFLSIGKCFLSMGRYPKALKYFNRGLNNEVQVQDFLKHSASYELLYQKSLCLEKLGKETEAHDLMEEIVERRKMFTDDETYDMWTNQCLYDVAQNLITTDNFQQAMNIIEDAWKKDGNRNMTKLIYLRVKSICLCAMHRCKEGYPLIQEHLQLLRHVRRSGKFNFSIDPSEAIVHCLIDLAKCAFTLGHYREAVGCYKEALYELHHKECKLASDTQWMQQFYYLFSCYIDKWADSKKWSEIPRTNYDETNQNELRMDIRLLFALGYRHLTNKNYALAIEYFQMAFDELPTAPEDIASRRRKKIEMKVLKRNLCQFATDRYRILMANALFNIGRNYEAFVQCRQAWREVSILDWTDVAKGRKLRTIHGFVLTPFFIERPKERFRAVDYAVTLALELGINHLRSEVCELLQGYLVCCLEYLPNCDRISYSYTPSVYYHAMKTIPAFKDSPDICMETWSNIREKIYPVTSER